MSVFDLSLSSFLAIQSAFTESKMGATQHHSIDVIMIYIYLYFKTILKSCENVAVNLYTILTTAAEQYQPLMSRHTDKHVMDTPLIRVRSKPALKCLIYLGFFGINCAWQQIFVGTSSYTWGLVLTFLKQRLQKCLKISDRSTSCTRYSSHYSQLSDRTANSTGKLN